jgi:hypothetical protein
VLAQLFNRSKTIELFTPLYISAYYSNGTWEYPVVSIYVANKWVYLSGTSPTADLSLYVASDLMTPPSGSDNVPQVTRYDLSGNVQNSDFYNNSNVNNLYLYDILVHPLENIKFLVGTITSQVKLIHYKIKTL